MDTTESSFFTFIRKAPFKSKVKLIFIFALAMGTVVISCTAIWKIIRVQRLERVKPQAVAVVAPVPELTESEAFRFKYELRKISLPLTDRAKHRMGVAQFSLVLDMPNFEAHHWMELNRAKLLTVTFDVGLRFNFEDFDAKGGLELFKKQLKEAYAEEFGAYAPRDIAFRDWITN